MGWFTGFPKETLLFLGELAQNNNKAWFDANKDRYKEHYEAPANAFAYAMEKEIGAKFHGIGPVHGKVFRIYRDTRFSKDKTPYKTHIGVRFGESFGKGCADPVFYAHIEHDRLRLITGIKEFEGAALVQFRRAVGEDKTGKPLEKIMGALKKNGLAEKGERYKRVPREFSESHPRADLLRAKGLYVEWDGKPPKEIHDGPTFISLCVDQFKQTYSLYDWFRALP